MKVSVIIPVYNLEKYIGRCLDSLVAQDFSDYEVIVVNDGSADNTAKICDEYAKKYSFIKAVHKENGGVSSARNTGIDLAQGEYVMFVDGDDYVTPDYISTMYQCQIENPDKLIVCDIFKKKESQENIFTSFGQNLRSISFHDKEEYFFLYKTWLSPYCWNKIFSKQKLDSNNIRFKTNYILGEDVIFTTEYYSICNGYVIISPPLYYYFILEDGADSKYRKNKFHKINHTFSCRIPLIKKEELGEFCDIYLQMFISTLKNTFDKRNTDSFFKKIKYNNSILKSEEFVFCLKHASKKTESKKYIKLLESQNYLWIYLYGNISALSKKIFKKQ